MVSVRKKDYVEFYDKSFGEYVYFIKSDSTWIDREGNLTEEQEIEYQLENYAKRGTIKYTPTRFPDLL